MPEPNPVILPQLNPNEIEVRLASLDVVNGQFIKKGGLLAVLETTKSTAELTADSDGYVVGLKLSTGDMAHSQDILCYLANDPTDIPVLMNDSLEARRLNQNVQDREGSLPPGLRITQKAIHLAQNMGIAMDSLPIGPLVTEAYIKGFERTRLSHDPKFNLPDHYGPEVIMIYGGGGHGRTLLELILRLGHYQIGGIIDDGLPAGNRVLDVPVVGGHDILEQLAARGLKQAVNGVGGIGNIAPRLMVYQWFRQSEINCPTVIHPTAFVESSAQLSDGIQVFALAYIGSLTRVGFGAILNTGTIVSHDCVIGDYANLSPGAILAGGVEIGDRSLLGMGVTVNLGVNIGADTRIGNSAVIKADVPDGQVIHAGSVWPQS
jgi:acetyltransferase EpsM